MDNPFAGATLKDNSIKINRFLQGFGFPVYTPADGRQKDPQEKEGSGKRKANQPAGT
jgi:hypothetical protein